MKNPTLFLHNNAIFEDVINILSGTHPTTPIPDIFTLKYLFELYHSIPEKSTDPIKAYFIWKKAVAWELSIAFGNYDNNKQIISEFEPLWSGSINQKEGQVIDNVMSKLSNNYQWLFSRGHTLQNNLRIIKLFTNEVQILNEFVAFYPEYPLVKKFNEEDYWDDESLELFRRKKNCRYLFGVNILLEKPSIDERYNHVSFIN